jgi:hypothetical protein
MAGFCGNSNEPSSFLQKREISPKAQQIQTSQLRVCAVELVL